MFNAAILIQFNLIVIDEYVIYIAIINDVTLENIQKGNMS